ncbi:MAG: hypothetical protein CMO61_14615 [Verrucomicrobiales bacterium]|nr:hypothetical protein [Verrucomicrobiales bacterium]|tara:strand:- start:20053 stop:20769 length:717 start_codon:yes stop_codon:yes gene_type:complete
MQVSGYSPEALATNEIRVSSFRLDHEHELPIDSLEAWLSDHERERAKSFHFKNHRARYIRGRAVTRLLLAAHLNCSPGDLEFQNGEHGKPRLAGGELHFNLSHSLDRAVIAISRLPSVGIDIECFSRDVDIDGLSRRCFREVEIARYEGMTPEEKNRAFFWIWTAKEARMKASGEGFSLEPQKIEIEFESELPVRCLEPTDPACIVAPVLFSDGLVACTVACMSEFELVIEKRVVTLA